MEVNTYSSEEFFHKFVNDSSLPGEPLRSYQLQPLIIGLIIAYGTIFVLGVVANFWTACVIGCVLFDNEADRPKSVEVYIFVLCCSDFVIVSSLLLLLSDLISGYWIVGSTYLCYLYLFSETLNKFFGPFILTALSGTCYVSICRPTPNKGSRRDTIIACVVATVCVISAVILTTPVYLYGDVYYLVVHNGSNVDFFLPKCMFQPPEPIFNVFTIYSFAIGYTVPALLFTFFYGAVLWFVHKHSRSVSFKNESYFWKIAKTTLCLVLFYLVCWTPYWAMSLYNFFTPFLNTGGSNFVIYVSYIIHLLPYINCAGYPILYTLMNRNIKKAYERIKERRLRKTLNDSCCCRLFFGKSAVRDRSCSIANSTIVSYNNIKNIRLPSELDCSTMKLNEFTPILNAQLRK